MLSRMLLVKLWRASLLSLVITAALFACISFQVFTGLENSAFDFRARLFRGNSTGSEKIALILIDEHSLQTMNPVVGRWPWPRYVYEDILSFLSMGGAKAVLFDILFTESDRGGGLFTPALSQNDSVLVEATRSSKNVYHSFQILVDREDERGGNILNPVMPTEFISKFSIKNVKDTSLRSSGNNMYYIPFPGLYAASRGVGGVDFTPDRDGVYRRTALLKEYHGNYFPALSIAPLLDILDVGSVSLGKRSIKLHAAGGVINIPVGADGSYLMKQVNTFNTYSISGIFESSRKIYRGEIEDLPVSPGEFHNKIVFIGTSAAGAWDLKNTTMGSKRPGVELHASITDNILNNDFLEVKDTFTTLLQTAFLTSAVCFLVIMMPTPLLKSVTPLLLSALFVAYWISRFKDGELFAVVPPSAGAFTSLLLSFAYLSFTEGKERRVVRQMLSRYISPDIMSEVLKDSSFFLKARTGTTERLTILFADIRGFTSLSEGLAAEEVVWILNKYLPEMVEVIFENHGTVDKFMGDAIMAFWGAPVKDELHALHAVNSAVEMFRRLEKLNSGTFNRRGLSAIKTGIGIHTGSVVLGNIGSEKKLDYTIIGDNVNLASRMEGLTKEYGISVLITEATYKEIGGKIPCRIIDLVRVKGRQNPVRIYGLLCTSFDPPRVFQDKVKVAALFEDAFTLYLEQNWKEAIKAYRELQSAIPEDKYTGIMIKRCEEFRRSGAEDWDGVYIMKEK